MLMNKIEFPTKNGYCWLNPQNIVSIHTKEEQSVLILKDESMIPCLLKVSECAKLLAPEGFFLIHRATLINLHFVFQFINGNERKLILDNGKEFHIPRRRKEALLLAVKKMTQKWRFYFLTAQPIQTNHSTLYGTPPIDTHI